MLIDSRGTRRPAGGAAGPGSAATAAAAPKAPRTALLDGLCVIARFLSGFFAGGERGVEGGGGRVEHESPDELHGLLGTAQPVHPGVLPLHGDGAGVADGVERAERLLPRDVAVARRHEVPAAPRVGPRQVGAEAAVAAVEALLRVLAVDVVDPVGEVEDEPDRVEVLPHEVRRVPVEAEGRAVAQRVEGLAGGPVVVGV